jgi:hypothetical protein
MAVIHAQEGPLHGSIENLSYGGALVNVAAPLVPFFAADVELELPGDAQRGTVGARTVRVEVNPRRRWRIAVAFDRVDDQMRDAIDNTISIALAAARTRPILVIDDRHDRRARLIELLATRGMTPLAPRTPLDAIELLTRAQLHVDVALLAPGSELAAVIEDSFPWVSTTEIDDDYETSAGLAIAAWQNTPVARLGTAVS